MGSGDGEATAGSVELFGPRILHEFRFWKQKILRLVFVPFLFQVFPIRSFVPPFVENAIFLGGSVWWV